MIQQDIYSPVQGDVARVKWQVIETRANPLPPPVCRKINQVPVLSLTRVREDQQCRVFQKYKTSV